MGGHSGATPLANRRVLENAALMGPTSLENTHFFAISEDPCIDLTGLSSISNRRFAIRKMRRHLARTSIRDPTAPYGRRISGIRTISHIISMRRCGCRGRATYLPRTAIAVESIAVASMA
jgi:hypothetical protein